MSKVRADISGSHPSDQARSGLGAPRVDPGRERGCDVCGRTPICGVASSGMGPISFGYCQECANKFAEPEFMFAMTFEDCGEMVAEWVSHLFTWKDGAYVSWPDWVATQKETPNGNEA